MTLAIPGCSRRREHLHVDDLCRHGALAEGPESGLRPGLASEVGADERGEIGDGRNRAHWRCSRSSNQ